MNAADLHRKLDDALDLLEVAERKYAELQDWWQKRNRLRYPEWNEDQLRRMSAKDAEGTKEWKDATADWSLAHDRIRSYAAAAMAKDLAEFLRPDVSTLPPLEFPARDWGTSAVTS